MFKNFMVYRIGAGWSATLKKVEESLDRARFTECAASQERSLGWVEPRGLAHGALVESVGGQWILKFMIEVRLLPASVVRRATLARIAKIEAKTGLLAILRIRVEAAGGAQIVQELVPLQSPNPHRFELFAVWLVGTTRSRPCGRPARQLVR